MIRIRRVYHTAFPGDKDIATQVQELLRNSYPDMSKYADSIPRHLNHPITYQYRTVLIAALTLKNTVSGFTLLIHFPIINYSLLDFIAVDPRIKAKGIGSALYEASREYTIASGSKGLFFESLPDDPALVKDAIFIEGKPETKIKTPLTGKLEKPILLVCSNHHGIHHVRERGYVERPARVDAIRETLLKEPWFAEAPASHFSESWLAAVHNPAFIRYLRTVCLTMEPKRSLYPYVFPIRHADRPPKDLSVCAGYYCIDTFTPLNRNAYDVARAAVDVALTCAEELRRGRRVAYALLQDGPTAVLDIDFHHGNGTQDIFYRRKDILTISIHGRPETSYPYFSGYRDERGEGDGAGFNINYPLREAAGAEIWLQSLKSALGRVARFEPI